MRFVRTLLPFLFVRNWYSGAWEFSRSRFLLFLGALLLFGIATGLVILLQSPVEYSVVPQA